MLDGRRATSWLLHAGILAASLLAALSPVSAIDGLGPRGWSPSRDDAVLSDGPLASASDIELVDTTAEMPAENRGLSRSLLLKRPRNLSRPAPGRTYLADAPPTVESLPSVVGSPISPEGLPELPGIPYYEDSALIHDGGCLACDAGCPDCCGNWNSCGPVAPRCLLPRPPFQGLELFGGVQGFTGPLNRGGSGSFGFHEGFNWGIPWCGCLAWQWGVLATQSTFDGNFLTADDRNQFFLTGGLFRRVDWGFQGGLVVDYGHDEWDYTADVVQLRGELSWLLPCRHEIGFWFTAGTNDANNVPLRQPVLRQDEITFQTGQVSVEVNNLYAFFYRRQFACGGEGRLFGGWTSNQQGLIGGDVQLPINPCWGLRAGFLYVKPDDEDQAQTPGFAEESWNVGISLVWTPCKRSTCGPNYCRPLFTVADNGSLVTRVVGQ